MSTGVKLTGLLTAGILCLPVAGRADTPRPDTQTPHRVHKAKKQQQPPAPLPNGPRGPVPQIPLDAMPAVAPQVTYQDGLLTIVAPNSTLSEILKGVRKHTSAEIEIPGAANERVATHLGPGPAREVLAELLNGSHFNYILLGSPNDANELVRVVLVPKTGPDNPPDAPPSGDATTASSTPAPPGAARPLIHHPEADASQDTTADDGTDEADPAPAPEPEQQPTEADQPAPKSPQQMLQEMQQRQLQMQQQNGQPGVPPNMPGRPPLPQPQTQQQQDQ
jgi:hypothetical protein